MPVPTKLFPSNEIPSGKNSCWNRWRCSSDACTQARLRSHIEQLVIVHRAIESNTPDEGQSRHGLPGVLNVDGVVLGVSLLSGNHQPRWIHELTMERNVARARVPWNAQSDLLQDESAIQVVRFRAQ